ncbi:helix-turn-helix domain-containing protein [Vibrio parahaemolyticus]|uniref:helix-turn-helix domain-containing protein n=1 Tax=Vibrio parahaemolyticus TaxID=670 RepID=UPI0015F584C6|nr:helix-turn-helix transcriptional regulator [Vibrio parahaemolyticus]ELX4139960.1 helix-turn-helix transcriptional regulator [Vibrio vulnificus]MBA5907936.1 helix-turn-helix transcriptional regulator [Vibrio parahaemolyticus]
MHSFAKWVESVGGASCAAKILGHPVKTIKSWESLYRYPTLENVQHIENALGVGVIDFNAWRVVYLKEQNDYPDV